MRGKRRTRWLGASAVVSGFCLAVGQLSFWLLVPDFDADREDTQTVVFCTAVLWLTAHALMVPALIGFYGDVFRRVGTVGGAGAVMAIFGTIGLCFYAFFLFPELIGFRPDSFHDFQIALALQAIGELGAALLIAGLLLLSGATIAAKAFPPAPPAMILAGALLAPFGIASLGWLALGSVLAGAGLCGTGVALLRSVRATSRTPWPATSQGRRFKF